jgi:hypothetical protein
MSNVSWTQEELDLLYLDMSSEELTNKINRTKKAIYKKRLKLGISKDSNRWKSWEDEYIKNNYKKGYKDVASFLGRGTRATEKRGRDIGILTRKADKIWTKSEIEFLSSNLYLSDLEIGEKLERTEAAIGAKRQSLGLINIRNSKVWTKAEDELLISNSEKSCIEISKMIKRSPSSISGRSRKLGVIRQKTQERWTEEEVLFVKNNQHLTTKELSEKLSRTPKCIDDYCYKNNISIKPADVFWTKKEICLLSENAKTVSVSGLSILVGRSTSAVLHKIGELGLGKGKRSSKKDERWRTGIFVRDGRRCAVCGSNEEINAHHLYSFSSSPDQRHDLNNGITLCSHHNEDNDSCHILFHKLFGFGNNTKEQFVDYVKNYLFLPLPIVEGISWYHNKAS